MAREWIMWSTFRAKLFLPPGFDDVRGQVYPIKVCMVFFCGAALLAIKLIDSSFTNDLRQFQEIASCAPLAMVAIAIDYISPDLGSLCHD